MLPETIYPQLNIAQSIFVDTYQPYLAFLFEYNELAENLLKEYKISGSEIQLISEITNLNHNEWYIDGIFGIGLSRNIKGTYSSIIERLSNGYKIISVDIASGINSNNGCEMGLALQARYTLAMGYPKIGHFFNSGKNSSGQLKILDIGLNTGALSQCNTQLLERSDVMAQKW